MGTRIIEFKYDDMGDGDQVEAAATVYLSDMDGNVLEIDLSAQNLLEYNGAVARFVPCVRPAELGSRRRAVSGNGAAPQRRRTSRPAKIRAWCRKMGIAVNDRGRIPVEIEDKYDAALRNTRTLA